MISFVIPTVNRKDSIKKLLESFVTQTKKADEILIVDQGEATDKDCFSQFNLSIKYFKVDFVSLTKARNFGVEKSAGDVIGFLDDDIVLDEKYVEKIEDFFVNHREAFGVQGVITNFEQEHIKKVGGNKYVYFFYNLLAKFFLLNNSSSKNKLLWSGRNQYASRVDGVVNCEWLSGIGNYRRKVFEEFKFDEKLEGYALGEDKLFSYQIFEKYPNSLYVDSAIKCRHEHNDFGQFFGKPWVKMKIEYTRYLWLKFFAKRGFLAYFAYFWANFGDLLMVFFSVLLRKNKLEFLWWHFQEYFKILWHPRRKILG